MNSIYFFVALLLIALVECKDYYKILGVDKSDSTATIKKAFRNLAMKYHPGKVTKNLLILMINFCFLR